jgi:Immunity protein 50
MEISWLSSLSNPQGVLSVYGEEGPPPLISVVLHEVLIGREGPFVRLRFDLPAYPVNPPGKWIRAGFNTVQVEILLGGARKLVLRGVSSEMVVDVRISKMEDFSLVEIDSSNFQLSVQADSISLAKLTGYANGAI